MCKPLHTPATYDRSLVMSRGKRFEPAHRLSTVRHTDLIAVLEEGSIVELGTHEHLMRCKGLYRKLYDRQFGAAA
jgi:ABC-type bacteriocin/lantibiotic exporter with double-glycine peptidase domain